MAKQYKLTDLNIGIERKDDKGLVAIIPESDKNRDWHEYQKWLADGNHPLPPDEEFE